MDHNIYFYILTAFLVSYAVRVLPLTLIRKPIKSRFIRSFLYYAPYVTLAVMTFPAIFQGTATPVSGIIALVVGIVISYFGAPMYSVACAACVIVFITELIMIH